MRVEIYKSHVSFTRENKIITTQQYCSWYRRLGRTCTINVTVVIASPSIRNEFYQCLNCVRWDSIFALFTIPYLQCELCESCVYYTFYTIIWTIIQCCTSLLSILSFSVLFSFTVATAMPLNFLFKCFCASSKNKKRNVPKLNQIWKQKRQQQLIN